MPLFPLDVSLLIAASLGATAFALACLLAMPCAEAELRELKRERETGKRRPEFPAVWR